MSDDHATGGKARSPRPQDPTDDELTEYQRIRQSLPNARAREQRESAPTSSAVLHQRHVSGLSSEGAGAGSPFIEWTLALTDWLSRRRDRRRQRRQGRAHG